MLKIILTREIEGEGGGVVRFWVNPPSGYVRRMRRAMARVNVGVFQQEPPKDPAAMAVYLEKAQTAFNADDALWESVLPFIHEWTLVGWSEDGSVLPVSLEGLDMLSEAMRSAVLDQFSNALEEVAKLDPQTGKPLSSTKPDESDLPENRNNIVVIDAGAKASQPAEERPQDSQTA